MGYAEQCAANEEAAFISKELDRLRKECDRLNKENEDLRGLLSCNNCGCNEFLCGHNKKE